MSYIEQPEVIWKGKMGASEFRVVSSKLDLEIGRRRGQVVIERNDGEAAMGEPRWTPCFTDASTTEFWLPLIAEIIASKLP